MKLIYNNFDSLDITFQGALPLKTLDRLAEAKSQAQNEKRDVAAHVGLNNLTVMVGESGAKGGYRYRFDTGLDGETWFIAHSTNSKLWNIRVSVKSLALALSGYEGVRNRLIKRLVDLEAVGISAYSDHSSGSEKRLILPLERISRFDYCFDFITDSVFQPLPERFVAHQRTKKHVYSEHSTIPSYSASSGDRISTIRVGQMPNRQVTIYNKTTEIIASSKNYWWNIWGLDKNAFKESDKQIWRVEVRAGKEELNKWHLKRFDDFDTKAGDVIASILKAIRYTAPINDKNRSRWPNALIWQHAISTSYKALAPYSTNAIRENVIRDYRENIIKGYNERLIGNLIGKTAAQGRDISELVIVAEELESIIEVLVRKDKKSVLKKYKRRIEQFEFIH